MSEVTVKQKVGEGEVTAKEMDAVDGMLAAVDAMRYLTVNILQLVARGCDVAIDSNLEGDVINGDGTVTYTIKCGRDLPDNPKLAKSNAAVHP